MNCRGLLILVVALIGLQLNVITPKMQLVFVIGALVTTMMTGPLVDVFLNDEQRSKSLEGISIQDIEDAKRKESSVAAFYA